MIIAIDGPAASGKSTVARALARRLGIHYLDTGAMYRAVAWLALQRGVDLHDEDRLAALTHAHPVTFHYGEGASVPSAVSIDGHDVTTAVRLPAVDAAVSAVARVPAVREAMVEQQRAIAAEEDSVVEGRDIGTVVFPDADVKVFLTASADERARRRQIDLAGTGHAVAQDTVRETLERRDHADSTRPVAPLGQADDAVALDTTGLSVDEVVDAICALVEERR